ncbi:MAG: hypothetical protein H6621_01580 [Halobacteriovoraceae bacterium]|nr:hypothetical protein [Halobacteriovoraceae bacterium]
MNLRFSGAYDKSTLELLSSLNIEDITIDFRPRSFNFIPQHHLIEILEQGISFKQLRYLFSDDKDFVISEIIKSTNSLHNNKVILEFDCIRDLSFLNQLEQPFYMYLDKLSDFEDWLWCKNFKGAIISYKLLEELYKIKEIKQYAIRLESILKNMPEKKVKFDLKLEWNDHISFNINEYVDIDRYVLCMSPELEKDYREVNFGQVQSLISNINNEIKQVEKR